MSPLSNNRIPLYLNIFADRGVYFYICTMSGPSDVKQHRMSANWSSAPLQPLRVSRTSTLLAEYQPCVRNVESQNRCWKTFQKRIDAERICAATPTSVSDLFPLCCVLIKRLWNKGTWETCSSADTALGDPILHLHFSIVAEHTLRAPSVSNTEEVIKYVIHTCAKDYKHVTIKCCCWTTSTFNQ